MTLTQEQKYKVLFIAKNIPVPGVLPSRVVIDIAHQLSDFANVSFLYPKEIVPFGFHLLKKYKPFHQLQPWEYEGFQVDTVSYIRIPYRKMAFWLWNKLSKKSLTYYHNHGSFDLVHAHYLFPDGYLAYLYSRHFSIPYIVTIRNSDLVQLRNIKKNNPDFKKAQLIIQHASKVLCLNRGYKDFMDNLFNISAEIIPHGIENNAFADDLSNPEKVIITTVASAIKRKNIDWVIRAFNNYKGKQIIELNIAGSGPEIDNLQQLANNDRRICFKGKIARSEVLNLLQKSDIFALPSYDETYGLTYVEAAATHNAIIGLKNEGVWGVFKDKKEMYFCKDEVDFQKMLHGLIDNPTARNALKDNAYSRAENLNWAIIKKQYQDAYQNAMENFQNRIT